MQCGLIHQAICFTVSSADGAFSITTDFFITVYKVTYSVFNTITFKINTTNIATCGIKTDVAGPSVTSSDLPSADLSFNSICSNICGIDFESNFVEDRVGDFVHCYEEVSGSAESSISGTNREATGLMNQSTLHDNFADT